MELTVVSHARTAGASRQLALPRPGPSRPLLSRNSWLNSRHAGSSASALRGRFRRSSPNSVLAGSSDAGSGTGRSRLPSWQASQAQTQSIGIELSHDIDDHAGGDRVTAASSEDLHLLDVSYPDAMAASTGSETGHPDLPGAQDSPYLICQPGIGYQLLFVWDTDQLRDRAPKSGAPHRMELQSRRAGSRASPTPAPQPSGRDADRGIFRDARVGQQPTAWYRRRRLRQQLLPALSVQDPGAAKDGIPHPGPQAWPRAVTRMFIAQ